MAGGAFPSLHAFFGAAGPLARTHPAYEFRSAQVEMARAVAAALAGRHHLLVEAGTGTGKTLAYLLPALASSRRVIVSTGTRNLQEQLIAKDVPLLARALERELRVVTVKGRQNYACRQKIDELGAQLPLLDRGDHAPFDRIRAWARSSVAGDQAELAFLPENSLLWQRLNARRETCTGQKCPRFDDCFLTALHRRAAEAELVIVNHHLFFADLALKRQQLAGVLPPYDAVIFDEAHEIEVVAGQYFGVSVSTWQIEELARDARATLALQRAASDQLARRIERLQHAGAALFAGIAPAEGRYAFTPGTEFLQSEPCRELLLAASALESGLDNLAERPEEIRALARRCGELRARLEALAEDRDRSVVLWVERHGRGCALQASPIDVAGILREVLFGVCDTVVLTSATLTVGRRFDYVRGRLGIEHARECIVASPYVWRRQALLYLAGHLPDPRDPGFTARAADEIEALLRCSSGRAFVLCTSYEQMRGFQRALAGRLEFPLLVQGGEPRHLLLERFRSTPHAVLLATGSFWQGVDVQGEQLSCVIVDKLPFASPADPVVAARMRVLAERGGSAFYEFQVPEAVLALKQGMGRLIRSGQDRGVVALLDPRILRKHYGRHFLRSLPDFACTTQLDDVRRFFAQGALPRASVRSLAGWSEEEPDGDFAVLPDGE